MLWGLPLQLLTPSVIQLQLQSLPSSWLSAQQIFAQTQHTHADIQIPLRTYSV